VKKYQLRISVKVLIIAAFISGKMIKDLTAPKDGKNKSN
jgi:hypothetical protein